ncbi:hypothetical protein ACFFOP_37030 [Sinosporangium siamense]
MEPHNFNRRFDFRVEQAGVHRITVHGTRGTCATLLAALDVHPEWPADSPPQPDSRDHGGLTDATEQALRKLGGTLGT